MPSILTLGARNLGGTIVDEFAAIGWDVAAVSLSEETAEAVRDRHPEALAYAADAGDPDELRRIVGEIRETFGSLDVAVNAVSPRGGGPGSGELTEAPRDGIDRYARVLVPEVYTFYRICGGAMAEVGQGSLIQVTGGSARRAMKGKGAWAAGAFATRALTQAAALELRESGVHVALLVVDGVIDANDASPDGEPDDARVAESDVVAAVTYLVGQSPRGWTHELVITPRGDRWVP